MPCDLFWGGQPIQAAAETPSFGCGGDSLSVACTYDPNALDTADKIEAYRQKWPDDTAAYNTLMMNFCNHTTGTGDAMQSRYFDATDPNQAQCKKWLKSLDPIVQDPNGLSQQYVADSICTDANKRSKPCQCILRLDT